MHPNTINLAGQKFGRLTAIRLSEFKSSNLKRRERYWTCLCDCGIQKDIISSSLRSGNTQSCGCINKERVEKMCGDFGKSIINKVYIGYKNSAKKRDLDWKLSKEEFLLLVKNKCTYCGASPEKKYIDGLYGYAELNGIDRKDSSIGYIFTNCTPCCSVCNQMKWTFSKCDFLNHIQKIYRFNYESR